MSDLKARFIVLIALSFAYLFAHFRRPSACPNCGQGNLWTGTRPGPPGKLQVRTCLSCGLHQHRVLYAGESIWSQWIDAKFEPL